MAPAARDRLRVCYLVPGHALLSTQGPTRNVLSLARALAAHAEVTVAFRGIVDAKPPEGIRAIEIEPGYGKGATFLDDSATRGLGLGVFARYLRTLRRFAHTELKHYDIVLEKSWLLSGWVSGLCRRQGILGVPVENLVPNAGQAAQGQPLKRLRVQLGRALAGRFLRQAPLVIAETSFLEDAIQRVWRVPAARIEVVPLGVDKTLFHPADQAAARQKLGIAPEATLLTYVGILDGTHNIGPLLQALAMSAPPGLELHVVGEGPMRQAYAAMAERAKVTVRFHGRVPHLEVPMHIAAADLCLAPYDSSAFANGELGYSSMKVPEYLAAGRPVAAVPSGRMRELILDGRTGFLLDNEPEGWQALLGRLPDREGLRRMGEAAAAVPLNSWDDTARAYLAAAERVLGQTRQRPTER
jgi:glycosyltransferase involved in cell wall biosynthesis